MVSLHSSITVTRHGPTFYEAASSEQASFALPPEVIKKTSVPSSFLSGILITHIFLKRVLFDTQCGCDWFSLDTVWEKSRSCFCSGLG